MQKEKSKQLQINNKKCLVSLYLTIEDLSLVLMCTNKCENDIKNTIAKIIGNHVIADGKNEITIEEIANDEKAMEKYILGLVQHDEKIKVHYDNYESEESYYKRITYAINDMWKEQGTKITNCLENSIRENIPMINNNYDYIGDIAETLKNIGQMCESYNHYFEDIGEILVKFNHKILSKISNYEITTITEEKKKELCKSYELWGKYGWTIIPQAKISLYNHFPNSYEEANIIANDNLDENDILKLFEDIRNQEGAQVKDFDESVFCYENEKYKACAMILFSLIDSKLIRMQGEEDKVLNIKRRGCGLSAVNNINKIIEFEVSIDETLFLLLSYKNLFSCLESFFANGNDFKEQPLLANRNFVDHGMLIRDVEKSDCIQLFLLYYNFLDFINIINQNDCVEF